MAKGFLGTTSIVYGLVRVREDYQYCLGAGQEQRGLQVLIMYWSGAGMVKGDVLNLVMPSKRGLKVSVRG